MANSLCAQDIGEIYSFKQSEVLKECDADGALKTTSQVQNVPSNVRFKVEHKLQNGDIVISILRWVVKFDNGGSKGTNSFYDDNIANNQNLRGNQSDNPSKFFLLTAAQYVTSTEKPVRRTKWTFATGSTLLKYRPGSSDRAAEIGNNFNIGLLGAYSFQQDEEKSHTLLFGAGIGTVKLTPSTTRNTLTEDLDVASFSPTLGYVFQVKSAQIGIMTGIDLLSGKSYRQWDYRGRPWIGFGVGFSLFKIGGTAANSSTQP